MVQNPNFTIKAEEHGKVVAVFIEGFLDETAGQVLTDVVNEKIDQKFSRFVLDFKNLRNICSPSVAAVLDLAEKINDTLGGKMIISGLSELNLKIFEMVGIFLYAEACQSFAEAETKAGT